MNSSDDQKNLDGPLVMRMSEFIKAAHVYQKQSAIYCFVPLLMALFCILTCIPLRHRFESILINHFSPPAVDVLSILPVAISTTLAVALMIPLSRIVERRFGILCPHCGKSLSNFRMIVVASRNCPYCGETVLTR